jgi:hypothetical protein
MEQVQFFFFFFFLHHCILSSFLSCVPITETDSLQLYVYGLSDWT